MIYLDANATEPLRPEARAAAMAALDLVGNPASIHQAGRAARRTLEDAREAVAAALAAQPAQLVFTSGGTEANAMAIAGLRGSRRILVGATEHDAVRAAAGGAVTLRVGRTGRVDLDHLWEILRDGPPALVCLMLANNETGVINPIRQAADMCAEYGAILHVDAVQGPGRMPVSISELGAHSIAVSGHKIGGPKGAGALVLAPGIEIDAFIRGGGQELGRRGGTPPLPAIAGFGAACAVADASPVHATLRGRLEAEAVAAGAVVCGSGERLPNTTCIALPGKRADMQVIALDLAGIAVSAGAACSSGKIGRSHVLDAMGLGEIAGNAIRVSLPWNVQPSDIDAFVLAYSRLAAGQSLSACS